MPRLTPLDPGQAPSSARTLLAGIIGRHGDAGPMVRTMAHSPALLQGYQATTHWAYHDLLPLVGAEPTSARIVEYRNRITGGGVTSGIDFGLSLLGRLAGDDYARGWQLGTEYDPDPPFDSGTPDKTHPMIKEEVLKVLDPRIEAVRGALEGAPGYVGE